MPLFQSMADNAGPPSVFGTDADLYRPWPEMGPAVMNGPPPLSRRERDLILAAGAAGGEFGSAAGPVFAAGGDEHALHGAIAVIARAAFLQRLTQGCGFVPVDRATAANPTKTRVEDGYVKPCPTLAKPTAEG